MKENIELYRKSVDQGYANAVELGAIHMRNWNNLLDKQMEAFELLANAQVRQTELLSNVKDYPEYLVSQARLGRELTEGLMAKGRETMDTMGSAREEYRDWLEQTVNSAGEKLWQAAEAQA